MEYKVQHKETSEEKVLTHLEINDMIYGRSGEVIVFDTNQEAYLLIDEE